jgi:CMP-N-acetylneuraminic acid synthetase
MIAYIPARGGSKRIPRKNIKPLAGRPSIGHVIENIKQLEFIEDIYVSTDDMEIQQVAVSFGAMTMGLRSPRLCSDKVGFMQLIQEDIPRFIREDKDVLFALATACLVPAPVYREAFRLYKKNKPQLLMAAMGYQSSPFKALVQKEDGCWRYLFPKESALMSQDMPQTRVDAGLFYFFNTDDIKGLDSFQSIDRLGVYDVPAAYAVDVDTDDDWQILEEKCRALRRRR